MMKTYSKQTEEMNKGHVYAARVTRTCGVAAEKAAALTAARAAAAAGRRLRDTFATGGGGRGDVVHALRARAAPLSDASAVAAPPLAAAVRLLRAAPRVDPPVLHAHNQLHDDNEEAGEYALEDPKDEKEERRLRVDLPFQNLIKT